MLPIRFVAEGFHLGVAWDGKAKTVFVLQNGFDESEYARLKRVLPAYSGTPYVEINGDVPYFKDYEIISGSFEYYSDLDLLGRCDVCMASVAPDLMPTEERESISSVTPTGWKNASYEIVEGDYLYNRCHLIGYQLTGENANKQNLITGTRYLNVDGMLPFENMVADYVEKTGNHVMYRVTPVFSGNNLVADGVLMEAYSVEDQGAGVSFCVYCYNVQPEIHINYLTGDSWSDDQPNENSKPVAAQKVYRTPSGKKYHFDPECGGKNSYEVTMDEALSAGLTACAKCVN
ncbi:MAG: DNA/RNA non-specific endonuclease [Oscillospiraceae bacterium]|nr:DNA/RNA non-specific endonuclease [Oscillospiraceae bacterium]